MLGLDPTCGLVARPTTAKKRQRGTEKAGAGSMSVLFGWGPSLHH